MERGRERERERDGERDGEREGERERERVGGEKKTRGKSQRKPRRRLQRENGRARARQRHRRARDVAHSTRFTTASMQGKMRDGGRASATMHEADVVRPPRRRRARTLSRIITPPAGLVGGAQRAGVALPGLSASRPAARKSLYLGPLPPPPPQFRDRRHQPPAALLRVFNHLASAQPRIGLFKSLLWQLHDGLAAFPTSIFRFSIASPPRCPSSPPP